MNLKEAAQVKSAASVIAVAPTGCSKEDSNFAMTVIDDAAGRPEFR